MQILLFCIVFIFYQHVEAGFNSNCEIPEFDTMSWISGYTLPEPINDTHRGVITSFKTYNITGMKVDNPIYLNAFFENDEIVLFVTERFKNFEVEIKGSSYHDIKLKLDFNCTHNTDSVYVRVNVLDINNHLPVFSRPTYEYNINMMIPKDFVITQLLPISASDIDFTNSKITYSFESKSSEYFALEVSGTYKYPDYQNFYAQLKAKRNITEAIREELVLVATDVGTPNTSSSTSILIIDINPTSRVRPSVFAKNLYYANYTQDNKLIIEEPIIIVYGDPDLIEQLDYTDYFEVRYYPTLKEIRVQPTKPLPINQLQNDYIILRIGASYEGQDLKGLTSILITASNKMKENDKIVIHEVCTFSDVYFVPIGICFSFIIIILFLNFCVISSYLKRQKLNIELSNQLKTQNINDIKIPL